MPRLTRATLSLVCASLAAAGLLAACGGGSSSNPTAISGSVVKGPVNGARVCAYRAVAAGKGDVLLCTTSNATGGYTMELDFEGDVVIEATGGTYTDEATGTTKTLADPLQVVIASQGGSAVGHVTPLTSVAYSASRGMSGGVTSANFATSAATVASQFQLAGTNIATTAPVVSGAALNAYGQMMRAVSQYVANGNSLATFTAFASPAAIQQAFATAYATANGNALVFNFGGTTTTVTPGTGGTTTGGTTGGTTTGGTTTGGTTTGGTTTGGTTTGGTTTGGTTTGGTTTGGTTTGGTTTGGAPAATESCGITVAGSGTVNANGMNIPFALPATKVCVTGVPAGSCTAGSAQLQSLAAGGATPQGNYTLNYTYSYAANDCSGAIATVAFTR